MIYQLVRNPMSGVVDKVLRLSDMAYIPFDEANTDYQQYLTWLSGGNEPLPAGEA